MSKAEMPGAYHVDKYAIELINPSGDRVRFMEIFGESAAKSTARTAAQYWDNKPGYKVEVIQIQNENGYI